MSISPSLYRRHRPRTFVDVVGQEPVVRTLSNAVRTGAVHHAYLFVGPRGTGKTSMAKILAACLNCVDGATTAPCGVCESCVSIASATSLDVIEMDAASNNSVDDIRDLREKVAYAPVSGRHKVYILDEAHMLSQQAWNAFLKTLEEPPPRTIFVLATTEAQKVLPTVVDRCHRFDFARPSVPQLTTVVKRVADSEGIAISEEACALVARHATGSFRDALGTLEQLVTYAGGEPISAPDVLAVLGVADAEALFAAVDSIVARDPARALRAAAALADSGRDPGQVLRDLEVHGRELLSVRLLGEVPAELRVTPERDQRLARQAAELAEADAVRLLELVGAALSATADGAQAQIQLELLLVKASAPEVESTISALLARIERLEAAVVARRDSAGRSDDPAADPPGQVAGESVEAPPAARGGNVGPEPDADPPVCGPGGDDPPVRGPGGDDPPVRGPGGDDPPVRGPGGDDPPVRRAHGEIGEIGVIIAAWPAVVEMVRGQNALAGAALDHARPVAIGERDLTLEFPADQAFSKRKAEQDDHRRIAADALRNLTGRSLALRFALGAEPSVEAGAARPASEDELVQAFVEEFNAQELAETAADESEGKP